MRIVGTGLLGFSNQREANNLAARVIHRGSSMLLGGLLNGC
jgi:hypothetical protein